MKKTNVMWLCESAVMIALSTVLSLFAVIKMPYGGSVTAFSMVPPLLIAYRYGTLKGLATGFIHGLLQMFLGLSDVSYAFGISAAAGIAVILLDYIVAFGVLGLGGAFRKAFKTQGSAVLSGALLVCLLRFICHVISGCTVWAGVSIPDAEGFIYSLVYNSAYMIPETFVTLAGAWYVSRVIDMRGQTLSRNREGAIGSDIFSILGVALILGGVLFDALSLFSSIQTEAGYDITNVANADFVTIGIVSAVCFAIGVVLIIIGKKKKEC